MKLSKNEKKVYSAMLSSKEKEWTAEDLANIIYSDEQKPISWRHITLNMMRMLCAKTHANRFAVERTSNLGRGNPAVFSIKVQNNNAFECWPSE